MKFFGGNIIFVAVATVPAAAVLAGEVWLGVKAVGALRRHGRLNEFDVVMV